jgi:hypothetical protein
MATAPVKSDESPYPAPMAGLLSYLVPGLGQVIQGRIGKGLLFFVCIYGLFFYGQALGHHKNVFLPDTARENNPWRLPGLLANLYNRPQFAGQFWVGVAVWPAVWQYMQSDQRPDGQQIGTVFGDYQRTPDEAELNRLQIDGDKTWDLGWIYTVIAGVLNVLVIYDAFAGPAFSGAESAPTRETARA